MQERAVHLKYIIGYLKRKSGEEKYKNILDVLKQAGFEMPSIDRYNDMDWIPASWPTIFMVGAQRVLGWKDEDFFRMGHDLLAFSPFIRLFIKIFVSPQKSIEKAAEKWNGHYSKGRIAIEEYDEIKKQAVARLFDFKKHPLTCMYLMGSFTKTIGLITGSKNVVFSETKCMFKGDPFHEFQFKW